MHIALFGLFINTVEQLHIAHGAEGRDGQHLSLTSGEQTRTVYAGQDADLAREWADIVHASAVYALLLIKQPAADDELLGLVQTLVDLGFRLGIDLVELLVNSLIDGL